MIVNLNVWLLFPTWPRDGGVLFCYCTGSVDTVSAFNFMPGASMMQNEYDPKPLKRGTADGWLRLAPFQQPPS